MIEDGNRLGGQPSHIEISPNEAIELFSEIRRLNPINYVITSKEGASCKLLLQAKDLTQTELQNYVMKWKDGDWKVEYKKVSVIVVDPPPQTVHLHS
ncbi:MAG: hypothetical protein KGI25_07740 [Thaumarchaeota archaeon]|nr:hypothetical protein [Nitrososphaerota archaeon]